MTNRPEFEEVLGRVRRFEDDLSSIGVSVRVDVRGLDAEGHEYGTHELATCALCSAYERGFAEGRRKRAAEQSERFEGAMDRLLGSS